MHETETDALDMTSPEKKIKSVDLCTADSDANSIKIDGVANNRIEETAAFEISTINFKVVYNKQTFPVTFLPTKLISDLKAYLHEVTGVPDTMQKLMFKGLLKDSNTLTASKITDGTKIMLIGSKLNDVVEVNTVPSKKEIEATTSVPKEKLSTQTAHKKAIDRGKPENAMPAFRNGKDPLPLQPLSGMTTKDGGPVRLTFKLESDEVWIGTKDRTQKFPMGSIKVVRSEAIVGHEEYHILGLQLGPTEKSTYWIYWVPAQYIDAIKDTILGRPFF